MALLRADPHRQALSELFAAYRGVVCFSLRDVVPGEEVLRRDNRMLPLSFIRSQLDS